MDCELLMKRHRLSCKFILFPVKYRCPDSKTLAKMWSLFPFCKINAYANADKKQPISILYFCYDVDIRSNESTDIVYPIYSLMIIFTWLLQQFSKELLFLQSKYYLTQWLGVLQILALQS